MPISEAHKRANAKWDQANLMTLGVRLKRTDAMAFKEYAASQGKTCFLQDQNPESCKEKYRELHCIFHTVTASGLVTFQPKIHCIASALTERNALVPAGLPLCSHAP